MSIAVGVLAGAWIEISALIGIPAWIGFAGCTSFFVAGGKREGAIKSVFGNLSGILWATVALLISNWIPVPGIGAVTAGIISFMMSWQSQIRLLNVV